jgi:hypothetical protein
MNLMQNKAMYTPTQIPVFLSVFVDVCLALFLCQIPAFLCDLLKCVLLCFCIRMLSCKIKQCTLQQKHIRRQDSDTKTEQYTLQQKHIRRQDSDTKTEQYTLQQKLFVSECCLLMFLLLKCALLCFCIRFLSSYVFLLKCVLLWFCIRFLSS